MNDLINRLRSHQDYALLEPERFSPLDIVPDCLEAANVLEEIAEKQLKKRRKPRRKQGCVICKDGRYLFNHEGDLSTVWINRDGQESYMMVCRADRIPVHFCPRCGEKAREVI